MAYPKIELNVDTIDLNTDTQQVSIQEFIGIYNNNMTNIQALYNDSNVLNAAINDFKNIKLDINSITSQLYGSGGIPENASYSDFANLAKSTAIFIDPDNPSDCRISDFVYTTVI